MFLNGNIFLPDEDNDDAHHDPHVADDEVLVVTLTNLCAPQVFIPGGEGDA